MITKYNMVAVLTLALATGACGKGDKAANADASKMAADTSLASDLAAANGNTPAPQPALADTAAAPAPAAVPAAAPTPAATPAPAPAAVAEAPKKTEHHKKPSGTARATATTPASGGGSAGAGGAPSLAAAAAGTPPAPTVTASGNTMTSGGTGGGHIGVIAAGTNIALTSDGKICTNTNKVGDTFTATVANPVVGSNGAVIPAGSSVTGHVTALGQSKAAGQTVTFALAFDNIAVNGTGYPLDASLAGTPPLQQQRTTGAGTDAAKVGGGAVAGGILGAVLGHSAKTAVIGAAAGAAAGGGVAVATGHYDACLPQGGKFNIALNSDQQIKAQ